MTSKNAGPGKPFRDYFVLVHPWDVYVLEAATFERGAANSLTGSEWRKIQAPNIVAAGEVAEAMRAALYRSAAPKRLSILTATFRAPQLLNRAVASVLSQDNPNWELIISPDDGNDYSAFEQMDSRIRVVPSTLVRTGPGAARNRALNLASGDFVGVLDDDDILSSSYVGDVLKALEHYEAVTVPTYYVSQSGEAIRSIGLSTEYCSIAEFALQLGSMHVIGPRRTFPKWQSCFAQDVLHTCASIDRAGGVIPVIQSASYILTVRSGSTCTTRLDIDAEYAKLERNVPELMSEQGTQATRDLFALRRRVNGMFERRVEKNVGYHEFVKTLSIEGFVKVQRQEPVLRIGAGARRLADAPEHFADVMGRAPTR